MAKVFIIGAAGKVGIHLTRQLADNGHQVSALHRKPEQADTLQQAGATPVAGDIQALSRDALAALLTGHDAVIFTAGAGGAGIELTNAIDGAGLALAVDAAEAAKVRRFLLVSAFPDAGRGKTPSEGFENYMRVKRQADVYLAASTLDWTIVRPGTLTDEPARGLIHAGLAIPYGNIPRADVAATLAALIDRPEVHHTIIELTEGDMPVADALQSLPR
ncbi:SDR family oxidoreductase [Duffyella gerundensis]|uniref:SDR family oxidoreductase n=1 Tax=Duffyella gerundensis TaxID=1619313 RepID=UPI0016540726|nr:SDR family oxidoreductase [Duffyella gerundensis]